MADFSLQALHDEIESDTESMGYKEEGGDWKGDQVIADLLNSTTSSGAQTITRRLVSQKEIVSSIHLAEFEAISEARHRYLNTVMRGEVIDATETPVFQALNTIFNNTDMPDSRAVLLARLQRTGSRAEVLWGEGVTITASQVGHAANL